MGSGISWRSKSGRYIIEHAPEWICGNTTYSYGAIEFIMKRPI